MSYDFIFISLPLNNQYIISNRLCTRIDIINGKVALTYANVLKYFGICTLLVVTLKTGKKHQIRIHLSSYNYHIIGEKSYSKNIKSLICSRFRFDRFFLHSYKLLFKGLLLGRSITFVACYDVVFIRFIELLIFNYFLFVSFIFT